MYGALDVGFTLWRFSLFRGSFRDGLPGSFRDRFRFGTGEHVFAMFFWGFLHGTFLKKPPDTEKKPDLIYIRHRACAKGVAGASCVAESWVL